MAILNLDVLMAVVSCSLECVMTLTAVMMALMKRTVTSLQLILTSTGKNILQGRKEMKELQLRLVMSDILNKHEIGMIFAMISCYSKESVIGNSGRVILIIIYENYVAH